MSSLNSVKPGSSVRIRELQGKDDQTMRLRELGFCENAVVHCLQNGTACVCRVHQARIALSAQLAGSVLVEPLR